MHRAHLSEAIMFVSIFKRGRTISNLLEIGAATEFPLPDIVSMQRCSDGSKRYRKSLMVGGAGVKQQ
jgi:hypothetical protein